MDNALNSIDKRLSVIEQRVTALQGTHDLLQEIIRQNLHQQQRSITTTTTTPIWFRITLFIDTNTNLPVHFQVSGKTYDIRDRLKTFGNPTFIKETKAWQYNYEENTYTNIVQYLKSISTEVHEETLVMTLGGEDDTVKVEHL